MTSATLTKEQKSFLEECNLEFSERFTDSDIEFVKFLESDIPSPPIAAPWFGKQRYNNRDRDRPGGSYNNFRSREYRAERDSYNHNNRGYDLDNRKRHHSY